MSPSSGIWGGVLDCNSQFTIMSPLSLDGPQLWRAISVCSSLYLPTRAHCDRCSPSIPLWFASHLPAPAGGRTLSPDCVLRIPVSHDRRRVCLLFLLVDEVFWAWCRCRFQQPICGYIATPSGRLPQKWFTKKDSGSRLYRWWWLLLLLSKVV